MPTLVAAMVAISLARVGTAWAEPAATVPPATDVVHARVSVPNEAQKVGEVRLVTRGDTTVVQTVIASRMPSRVLAGVREKELRNWPDGSEGGVDAARYLGVLEQAGALFQRERERLDPRDPTADRRSRLLIEFFSGDESEGVVVATFDSPSDAPYEVHASREIARPDVGRHYVLRNMRLILADAFAIPEVEVHKLGPLGPAAR